MTKNLIPGLKCAVEFHRKQAAAFEKIAEKAELDYKRALGKPISQVEVAWHRWHNALCQAGIHHDHASHFEVMIEDSSKLEDTSDALVEKIAKAIYEQWRHDPEFVEWVDDGNSFRQSRARQIARFALS